MKKRNACHLISTFLLSLAASTTFAKTPAFPGAEGFGAFAQGGRGGRLIQVTNLNDSGPGSLRDAVNAKGPRIIVFRVSGNIDLKSGLSIRNPYITIAGQTAPRDGICLKTYSLSVAADHVIIRFIRCRPGDNARFQGDAISISAGRDIIVDHCSASWSVDETLSASTGGQLGNVTVQWCIISESLNNSSHHKGAHGYGSLVRGGWGNGYTFHHNLYAHHRGRSPRPGNYNSRSKDPKGFIFDFRNNVIYNWGGSTAGYNADGSNGTDSITKMNFVGNYYKRGLNSTGDLAFSESTRSAKAYFTNNSMNGDCPKDPWSLVTFRDFSDKQLRAYKQSEAIAVPPVKTDDPEEAYARVLAQAGAVLPTRDAVDTRIVKDVAKGTGEIIDDEKDVGGWPLLKSAEPSLDTDRDGMPDDWEEQRGLNPNNKTDGPKDRDGDGYTNIEEYLNSLTRLEAVSGPRLFYAEFEHQGRPVMAHAIQIFKTDFQKAARISTRAAPGHLIVLEGIGRSTIKRRPPASNARRADLSSISGAGAMPRWPRRCGV